MVNDGSPKKSNIESKNKEQDKKLNFKRYTMTKQLTSITEVRMSLENENNSEKITKENILNYAIINIFCCSFSQICLFLIETTNLIFMGRSTPADLHVNSVGLGNIYLNLVGILVGMGILGGLDIMGTHAFRAYKFLELGIFTYRSRVIILGIFFFITLPLSFCSDYILLLLKISPDLVDNTYYYILYMLPAIFLSFNFHLNVRYLHVMEIYFIPSLIAITSIVIHILLCYFFVIVFELEIKGICIASAVTMLYCCLLSSGYILINKPIPNSLYFLPPSGTFNIPEFYEYLKFCLYLAVQHYGYYIGYEVVCFMCSYLSESSMTSSIIVLNYVKLIGYIYLGFSYPLSHMVGLFLGKKNFEMYKYCLKLFSWINIFISIFLGFNTYFLSEKITHFYIRDQDSAIKTISVLRMWTLAVFCDAFNIMYQAILIGAGKEYIISLWNLLMNLLWMIPASYLFCFILNFDIYGIWLACISYVVILCFVNFCYVLFLDEKEASDNISHIICKDEIAFRNSICYTKLGDEDEN